MTHVTLHDDEFCFGKVCDFDFLVVASKDLKNIYYKQYVSNTLMKQ